MVWIWFWRASRHLLKNIHIFWAARGSLRSKFGFPSDTIHMKSGESTIFTLVTVSLFPSERLEAVVLVFFFFLPAGMLQHSHLPENVRMFIPRIKIWAHIRFPK